MSTPIYALSVSGRVVLDMHSLNNEGGEGNQIQTRMVTIVHRAGDRYEVATVNGISGDMFKHIQTEHFYRLAKGTLTLCKGCSNFSASRALDDQDFMAMVKEHRQVVVSGKKRRTWVHSDGRIVDELLRKCCLDDVAGNLIAPSQGQRGQAAQGEPDKEADEGGARGPAGGRSIPRKSVAEFGWVVGLPEATRTETYFHVRYAAERGGSDLQQPIFHRPASSGVYAVVANFETARIGFNDITQTYAIDEAERERRHKTLLESVLYTFVDPNGAMRATQNPHILGFEGMVTVSSGISPAPALSPLEESYREQLARVVAALNRVNGGVITAHSFNDIGSFSEAMQHLIAETTPHRMKTGE